MNKDLQTILLELIATVNNWATAFVVLGAVFGLFLCLRSGIAIYEASMEGGFSPNGGKIGFIDVGRHLFALVIGALITVFSLVIYVFAGWWVS
jgi:hypothetical protein